MDLFDIVANRPLPDIRVTPPRCPYCDGGLVAVYAHTHTLTGGQNHHTRSCACGLCGECFFQEYTDGGGPNLPNAWYTERRSPHILKGFPTCFEPYVYACAQCKGPVTRTYTDRDGTKALVTLTYDRGLRPNFRIFYRCQVCGHGGEVENEYWRGYPKPT